jgi:phage repressor protein C with HTH and peptisase S24 domain
MNILSDRIKLALDESELDQSALSRMVGVSTVAVNGWCTGATKSIKGENLLKASRALGVNPMWLATGAGNMRPGNVPVPEPEYPRTPSEKEYALIPQYSTKGCCGSGYMNEHVEVKGGLAFKRDWLARMGLDESNACVITASGDSMSPTIQDGDVMLLDTSIKPLRTGEMYTILMDEEVIVKRLAKEFGITLLRSDNPNKSTYPDISVPPGLQLEIIGRVAWRGGCF